MSSDSGTTARAATSGPSLTQQAGTASSTSGCTADAATSGPRLTPQASKTSSDSSTTARAATSGPSLTAGGPDELGRRLRGPCGDLQAVARAASRHDELGQRLPAPSRNGRRGLGQQLHGPRDDLRTAISQQAGRTSSASSSTTSGDLLATNHAAGWHGVLGQRLHGLARPLPARRRGELGQQLHGRLARRHPSHPHSSGRRYELDQRLTPHAATFGPPRTLRAGAASRPATPRPARRPPCCPSRSKSSRQARPAASRPARRPQGHPSQCRPAR